VVIAYDPNAMIAVGPLWEKPDRPKLVWHFHELWLPTGKVALSLTERAIEYACRHAGALDLVVFPDGGRADIFAKEARLTTRPTVVMNCPPRMAVVPEDHLTARLAQNGMAGFSSVYFHGSIGPSRCLETVIRSMRSWPERTSFVMVGPVAKTYRNALIALARQVGSEERVLFLGNVLYGEVFHLAAGATVGCSLLGGQMEPNWIYSAGAINKRFEYMSVGLPQVANFGAGMREIIEEPGCGILADVASPASVGAAIAQVLQNETLRTTIGANSRAAHLDKFNYETQFRGVLERIVHWCNLE
jgi:glycosyltransferase involved in cell wall biosynthesis